MGFEDETPNTTDEIEAANLYAQKKRLEAEKARAETLLKKSTKSRRIRSQTKKAKRISRSFRRCGNAHQNRPTRRIFNISSRTYGRNN